MEEIQDLYFELSNSGNLVRIEPKGRIEYNSDLDYDKNWINTKVTIKGGNFSGQYTADFLTRDFNFFKSELSKLYDNLKGATTFCDLEGYLELKIIGDGFGHFDVAVKACDNPGIYGSELTFNMEFDQTQIKKLTNQLGEIMNEFPIIGGI
jgi:hypothetical protein